jgi:hypothetical protein
VPFAEGLQDARLGLAENVVLYEQKDAFNGEFKYFSLRPNIVEHGEVTEGGGASIGAPIDVSQWEPALAVNLMLATTLNVYSTQPNTLASAIPILTGADLTNYRNNASVYNPKLVKYQNVATVGNSYLYTLDTVSSVLYNITNIGVGAYTTIALGFSPCPVGTYMDGYCFVAQFRGDTIYNSNLNDITVWNTGVNNIRATQFTGEIRALARQANYILAFKENSIEYFYNAGLTNTSPLQRQVSYTKRVGLAFTNSLAQRGDTFYFIGQENGEQECGVYSLTNNTIDKISTPEVDRYLIQLLNASPNTNSILSYCIKVNNKEMYFLTNKGDAAVGSPRNFTLVYDSTTKTWATWYASTSSMFPLTCTTTFSFLGGISFLDPRLLVGGTAKTYQVNLGVPNSYFNDCRTKDTLLGQYSSILATLRIPSFDFGTGNRKFMHEMSLSSIAPQGMQHQVTFTKTVGGNRQTIAKATGNGDNMNFKNWGQFVSGYVTYFMYDPTISSFAGFDASQIRMNGVNMEISQGIS